MAVSTLCTAFRRIAIGRSCNVVARYCSTHLGNQSNNCNGNPHLPVASDTRIKFVPGSLSINFDIPSRDGIVKSIIETPFKYVPSMEEPVNRKSIVEDSPLVDKSVELPTSGDTFEKLATRMVVIRRKKMKKHKRRKLRKKMKQIWVFVRTKRNLKREKEFQTELVAMVRHAEGFDAKAYVAEKIKQVTREILPMTYRGEILPKAMIRKFLTEKEEKEKMKRNKPRLTL